MSEPQPDPQGRFPPADYCIYCGSKSDPLSDEHIIAFALGGNYILPKASCQKCAKITTKIEGHCLGGMLRNFRVRIGMQSRQPRPSKLPLHITTKSGATKIEYIPVEDYPAVLTLPHYPVPGILDDRPATKRSDIRSWYVANVKNLELVYEPYGGKSWTVTRYKPIKFSQMLAKIAHAHAIATSGTKMLGEFEPLLPEFIIGDPDDPCYLVGCAEELPPSNKTRAHVVDPLLYTTPEREYLLIAIRLFADLGSPQYYVVTGVRQITGSRETQARDPQKDG